MKVFLINYGMGNLSSVKNTLEKLGVDAVITDNPADLHEADKVILPGVGSFGEGMQRLSSAGWIQALNSFVSQEKKPILGICLGMQMLATTGHEGGITDGLGFVPGKVERLDNIGCQLRIPHVGWNDVAYTSDDMLFESIPSASDFYFVHSYAFIPNNQSHLIATASYGVEITAAVRNGNVYGCQFHPEKSSKAGRHLLNNFLNYSAC